MGSKRKNDFEPYWQDEKDWLCTVEFLPTDDPEARLYCTDIIGYLVGYAHCPTRALWRFLEILAPAPTNCFSPFRLLRRKTSS